MYVIVLMAAYLLFYHVIPKCLVKNIKDDEINNIETRSKYSCNFSMIRIHKKVTFFELNVEERHAMWWRTEFKKMGLPYNDVHDKFTNLTVIIWLELYFVIVKLSWSHKTLSMHKTLFICLFFRNWLFMFCLI